MRMMVLLLALVGLACAPIQPAPPRENVEDTPTAVRLSVERLPQNAVRLTLDNGARHPIGFNLCTSSLQRRSGGTWDAIPTNEVCTMHLATLNPGADATFEKSLPANLPAGEYRYVTAVEMPLGTAQKIVAGQPFTVR